MPKKLSREERPVFPKRAVVTGGMPYGNKKLHFGHIGGVFVFADVFTRFLKDRIGADNVIFVSGTDCYGSPIVESYRKLCESGYSGTIEDFVRENNAAHKATLKKYMVEPSLFEGSAIGRAGEVHQAFTLEFIRQMFENGKLEKLTTKQFFDEKAGVFLNGRQVLGRCPVVGCSSEKAYADECDLGHSYLPKDLINPKSTLSGETPVMKDVSNWYYKLPEDLSVLKAAVNARREDENTRPVVTKTVSEFLEPPVIHIMNDYKVGYDAVEMLLPRHEYTEIPGKTSFTIRFKNLSDREKAEELLSVRGIRFRTGKTLVPFRLTGNTEWGLAAPALDEADEREPSTVWVWPESLWAPISFTQAYLESIGKPMSDWKDYWCSTEAQVYQFIGQDNIYFYCAAEPGMFMAYNAEKAHIPLEGELQIPQFVANHHILFLDKKASSSGSVKPPMADELLEYYTPEQLRMHFISLGLGLRSVSFMPGPLNPKSKPGEADPVTKEGFLLNNVFNRIIRTVLYEVQKTRGGKLPIARPSDSILEECEQAALQYERFMYRYEFHQVSYVLDSLIRSVSKTMSRLKTESDAVYKSASKEGITELETAELTAKADALRDTWLIDTLHGVKTALALLRPVVPEGVELVREYLCFPETVYGWEHIFDTLPDILPGCDFITPKFLEPRFDFFPKHPSQITDFIPKG
jgi:methionyl-tRNA synthetase